MSAQASSSTAYDLDHEGPIASLAREKLAHDNSGLNASWGNAKRPASINDDGWGSAPSNAKKPASVHNDGWLSAPSPQPTMDGSHTGLSDSDKSHPHQSGTVYGQNMSSKGPGKGPWKGRNHHGKNKRGRDLRDDWRVLERAEREARQKTWHREGRSVAESWFQSTTLRLHMRVLSTFAAKALRNRLMRADAEFQHSMQNIPFEHWIAKGNETKDKDPEAQLKRELGIPARRLVSPHFCYKPALWHCKNAINAVVHTETSKEDRGVFLWRQEFHDPKYDGDSSKCQVQDNFMPDNIKQLREVHGKVYEDYKTALHYLALQRRETKYYEARRSNFYHICIAMNGKRPTHTFMGKELHVQMNNAYHSDKRQSLVSSMRRTRSITPISKLKLSALQRTEPRWNTLIVTHPTSPICTITLITPRIALLIKAHFKSLYK